MVEEGMMNSGDLVSACPRMDEGSVLVWSHSNTKRIQPERHVVAKLLHGTVGIILYANSNQGEVFVLFTGPSIGWVWRSSLNLIEENACY